MTQNCVQIVKAKQVGLGHRHNTRMEGDLASLPDSLPSQTGSVPKKRQWLKTRAIKTLFGIKIDEAISE
jgi:hypothetical protein